MKKNVSELLDEIDTTQPKMSQHLSALYRAGVLGKRRDSSQIYYRLQSERVATLCRAVCTQVAIELDPASAIEPSERLRARSCALTLPGLRCSAALGRPQLRRACAGLLQATSSPFRPTRPDAAGQRRGARR